MLVAFSVSDHYHCNVNAKMRTVHTIPQKWWMSPLTENHICQTITIPWNWTLLPCHKLKITMSSWSILSLFCQLYCTFTSKYYLNSIIDLSVAWYIDVIQFRSFCHLSLALNRQTILYKTFFHQNSINLVKL